MSNHDYSEKRSTESSELATPLASRQCTLKRWERPGEPFLAHDPCSEGKFDDGLEVVNDHKYIPPTRPRTASQTSGEGWPQGLSNAKRTQIRRMARHHASSQTLSRSVSEGFQMSYGDHVDRFNDQKRAFSSGHGASKESIARSFDTADDQDDQSEYPIDEHAEDNDMGLAQQTKSKRYSSGKSPLSPTFSFRLQRDRKVDNRLQKSILKRESIRLSALPPMPQSGSRRSFPSGHGLASFVSTPQDSPGLEKGFLFPRTAPSAPTTPQTPRLVTYNGLLDPDHPQNRSVSSRLLSSFSLLGATLAVTFASSTLIPTGPAIPQAFGTTSAVITLASALTVLGFAVGSLIFCVCSELHGRKRPLLAGLAVFAIFNIPVALTENLPTLLAFRFCIGLFGAAPLVIVPAALADLWHPVGRGISISFFAVVLVIGPIAGTVAGSHLVDVPYPGWRWTAWMATALGVLFGALCGLAYQESCAPVLLRQKAQRLRTATKDWALHAPIEETSPRWRQTMVETLLLLIEPCHALPTIHMSFACGLLYLFFITYQFAFRERNFTRTDQDLPLLPIVAGCFIGIFINFIVSKKKYSAVVGREGQAPPEARLVPWIIGSWILPVGLLVFAWTSRPDITFVPQVMAGVPTGIGISLVFIGGLNYILDSYITMPSLTVGASTFIRSALAFAFPLFASPMYQKLGITYGNTVLAVVAVLLVPVPIVLLKLGPRLRKSSKLAVKPQPVTEDLGHGWSDEMVQRDSTWSVKVSSPKAPA